MHNSKPYRIDALDSKTYIIASGEDCYMLLVTPIKNGMNNTQITITNVLDPRAIKPHTYLSFGEEIWTGQMWVKTSVLRDTVATILQMLANGVDVANPVDLSASYGGQIYGKTLSWPQPRGCH